MQKLRVELVFSGSTASALGYCAKLHGLEGNWGLLASTVGGGVMEPCGNYFRNTEQEEFMSEIIMNA